MWEEARDETKSRTKLKIPHTKSFRLIRPTIRPWDSRIAFQSLVEPIEDYPHCPQSNLPLHFTQFALGQLSKALLNPLKTTPTVPQSNLPLRFTQFDLCPLPNSPCDPQSLRRSRHSTQKNQIKREIFFWSGRRSKKTFRFSSSSS